MVLFNIMYRLSMGNRDSGESDGVIQMSNCRLAQRCLPITSSCFGWSQCQFHENSVTHSLEIQMITYYHVIDIYDT